MDTPPAASGSTAERPIRRDAARNRERILAAASELFAERGLSVHLNDIAHHAGVGVGTVYRHFPDKDELIETLFEARIDELVAIVEEASADPDPWRGLVASFERTMNLQAEDRGLRQLVTDTPEGMARVVRVRDRLLPLSQELVRRAQAAGALRADIDHADVPLIHLMVSSITDAARDVQPDLWRRYLALILRGMATDPDSLPELPASGMTVERVDHVMSKAPRRP